MDMYVFTEAKALDLKKHIWHMTEIFIHDLRKKFKIPLVQDN